MDLDLTHWVYDLESYPNIFTACFRRVDGKHERIYEISDRKNETRGLLDCLNYMVNQKQTNVGFNNLDYDYPMIHYIIENAIEYRKAGKEYLISASEMYDKTQEIIGGQDFNPFKNRIKTKDEYIRQIDLHKVHHFDNMARMTSLKMLEFNMRSDNISDLPYPVGSILDTDDKKDVLLTYNKKDVSETLQFYIKSLNAIQFREELTERFGFDTTNMNDSKIGGEYFIGRLEKAKKGTCYEYTSYGRKQRKTVRKSIDLSECILPYIKYETPEFNSILNWIKSQTITETKGVFNNIEEHLLGDVAKYCKMVTKKTHFRNTFFKNNKGVIVPKNDFDLDDKNHLQLLDDLKSDFLIEHPKGGFVETSITKTQNRVKVVAEYKEAPNLMVELDGFGFIFGTGGIHGCIESGVVEESEEIGIVDLDVN